MACPHGKFQEWQCKDCHAELMKAITTLAKASPKMECKHHLLHFERGGFHIVCEQCKRVWTMQLPPHNLMPDYTALAGSLSELDTRRDPLYVPPSK